MTKNCGEATGTPLSVDERVRRKGIEDLTAVDGRS